MRGGTMDHGERVSAGAAGRRARLPLALLLMAVATVIGGIPAHAGSKPEVTVSLEEPLVIEESAPPVPGYPLSRRNAEAGPTPENCADGGTASGYCDMYKVNLSVPDDVRARGGYLFTAVLEWDRGEEIANAPQLGSAGSNQLVMRIYEEPKYRDPETDAETWTAASGLNSKSPTALGVVDPAKPFYWVLVANYLATDTSYKLTLFVDDLVEDGPPIDLSVEEDLPPVFSAPSKATPPPADEPMLVAPAPAIGVTGAPSTTPALPALPGLGAPDFALDSIGGSDLSAEDLDAIVLARDPRPIPPAGDANALLLVLWLVVAPILVFGMPLGLLWRRRREEVVA